MRIKRARRTSSAGKVRERRRIFSSRRSEGVRCRACISMPKHTTCQYHFQCYAPLVLSNLADLLPLGTRPFRFLASGDLSLFRPYVHNSIPAKSFPLVDLTFDDTVRFF